MSDLTGFDAAYPPPHAPADQVVFGYLGGNTPHPWTPAEWAAQRARYRVGIWTRSNPVDAAQGAREGTAAVAAWRALGAPRGGLIVLDYETAVNGAYLLAFDAAASAQGYRVAVYGSTSTVFKNPKPSGGYFPADVTGKPHLYPGTLLTQFEFESGWDDDEIAASITSLLWDTQPAPKPPTAPAPVSPTFVLEEDPMQIEPLSVHPGEYAIAAPGKTELVLVADGYSGPPASLRIAMWSNDGVSVSVLNGVSIGGTSGHHTLGHTLPAGCTGVTVRRLDAEDYPVGIALA